MIVAYMIDMSVIEHHSNFTLIGNPTYPLLHCVYKNIYSLVSDTLA